MNGNGMYKSDSPQAQEHGGLQAPQTGGKVKPGRMPLRHAQNGASSMDEAPGHKARAARRNRAATPAPAGSAHSTGHASHAGPAMDMPNANSAHTGHSGMGHMRHMGNLGRRFAISLLLAVPVILLSPMMGMRLPFQLSFPGSDWLVLILASLLFFYGGLPFLRGARTELAARAPAMMTLISLGIGVAYLYSLYAFILTKTGAPHVMDFFWELATLVVIMLLGHWVEMRATGRAGEALEKMAALLPARVFIIEDMQNGNSRAATLAELRTDEPEAVKELKESIEASAVAAVETAARPTGQISRGRLKEIPLRELREGDKALIRAGDKIPADGTVLSGSSDVNEAMLTGEARAVTKKAATRSSAARSTARAAW